AMSPGKAPYLLRNVLTAALSFSIWAMVPRICAARIMYRPTRTPPTIRPIITSPIDNSISVKPFFPDDFSDVTGSFQLRRSHIIRRTIPFTKTYGEGSQLGQVMTTISGGIFRTGYERELIMVRPRRLELPRLAALPPQGSASTNSATAAC